MNNRKLGEFAGKLLVRFQDEVVNVAVWIGKVAVLLVVFDWIVRHYVDSSSPGNLVGQLLFDNDLHVGALGLLFVFAVGLYTITKK